MESVVVSLGGSVLIPDQDDASYLTDLAKLIRQECEERRLFLVCGGGKVARYYIETGRKLGGNVQDLDQMGIGCTRLNAELLHLAIGDVAVKRIPVTVQDARRISETGKVVIMGGTKPGHTTDAVAAMLAEEVKADRIVNATSVDAAYSEDPRENPKAHRYSHLSFNQLYDLVNKGVHGAGSSHVFDRLGADLARKNRIPIYIVPGRDLEEVGKAIRGEPVKGTLVSD